MDWSPESVAQKNKSSVLSLEDLTKEEIMQLRTKTLAGITVLAMLLASAYVVGWLSGNAGHDLRLLPEDRPLAAS